MTYPVVSAVTYFPRSWGEHHPVFSVLELTSSLRALSIPLSGFSYEMRIIFDCICRFVVEKLLPWNGVLGGQMLVAVGLLYGFLIPPGTKEKRPQFLLATATMPEKLWVFTQNMTT